MKPLKWIPFFLVFSLWASASWGQCTVNQTLTTTGSGSWTVPSGVTSITVEVWGAGGAGGRANGNPAAGGGGSGGGYVRRTFTGVSGSINYFIGQGGDGASGSNGQSSWFQNNTTLLAIGGNGGGIISSNSWGTGAAAVSSGNIGGTLASFYGGAGGTATSSVSGGGGASAGTSGNGNAASGINGGTSSNGSTAGASGTNSTSTSGNNGNNPGSGGSGGRANSNTDRNGGNGGNGQIIITYTLPANTVSVASSSPTICVNTSITAITHTTSGATGIGSISWSPSNPGGITASFSGNTISISGTPTNSGTFTYSIPMTGGCTTGQSNATGTITVTPNRTAGTPSSSPTLCVNSALTTITIATTGATGIGTATGLPAGVTASWASNTISITGTPTASGTFTYSIPLTGGCGTANASGTITVTPNRSAGTPSTTPTLCVNTALTPITIATTGATGIGTATGLPSGVTASWASNTITLSGTPTASGTFNYTIPLNGSCGPSASATGTITVTPNRTAGTPSAAPTLCVNTALTPITIATAGATGIGTATGLPAGVTASWSSNTITISGTPTASGTFNYSIPLTGGCGTANASGTITVTANRTAGTPSSSPTLCVNSALTTITIATTGATGIGTATGLPDGVIASWASNTITITGTPTTSGTFTYSIPLTGGCGAANASGTITVTPNRSAGTPSSTPTLCVNTALTAITIATTGATGIGTATGLPAGVTASWASNTITLSGTPTASGTFNYTILLNGPCGPSASATGTITVTANNTVGTASSTPTVCIDNALPPITHTTTNATGIGTATGLPAGVTASWASNTITISGTPTASGTFTYSIPLTGGCGAANATGTITVTPNKSVSAPSATPAVCINTALTPITHTTANATGIGTPVGLPAGVTVTWSSNTITISGTPTVSGVFNYTIPLTGNCGPLVNASGTITVAGGTTFVPNLECFCGNTFTNSSSFVIPAGVTRITIKAWGAGGKGGDRNRDDGRSGGGGAGAYSESTITVTPGETLYYSSGQGSSSTAAGGDSWISRASNGSNPIVLAKGGNSAAQNTTSGATGGQAALGIGTIRTNGANGSNAGGNGGAGGDSPNGGRGGAGATGSNEIGLPGNSPGGGGGGAKTSSDSNTRTGGNGGNGQITFTYSCYESVDPPAGSCWRYVDDGTASGVVIIEFFEDCNWSAPEGLLEFEVLAIGGGGGGGVRSGGGGGGGGAVHARALVGNRLTLGLPAGASFPISVGNGGRGSTNRNNPGENGTQSSFDQGGYYEIIAGSGGGGGSDGEEDNDDDDNDDDDGDENDRIMNRAARNGNPGSASSFRASSIGFSIVSSALYGGSGGGGGHSGAGGNANFRNGGNANRHSGGGGGGLGGNNGANAVDEERGGNGANGIQFSTFDISLNRFFGAGGGGGSEINHLANGGNSGAGGNGGLNDDEDATNGGNAITPGSGGGGSGHDDNTTGGNGAKGVVFVRYEIARILPVEFLYFKADYNSMTRSGDLTWSTAREWENDRFEIERSVNTVKDWETIGQLQGAGYSDSPVAYDFQDRKLPLSGGNIFYRLKQVDFNGKATYSDTKAIKVEAAAGTTFWRVYPNPTNGQPFNIEQLNNLSVGDEKVTLRAIAPTGQFQVFEVENIPGMGAQVTEWFKTQAAGIYTLEITWGEKREYHKVILNR